MKRVLLSAFLAVAIATGTASFADVQPDIRATGVPLALATANAAITVPLNFGMTMMHWQIVTGGTVNAVDQLIFENSPDGGTTWDGAPVVQYSTGTGTSTAFQGSIAIGGTLTPVASTTYDVFVPTGNETQTRVRVSTNHAGDSAATVAYSASAVGFVPSQRFDANGNPYVNCAVNCATPIPQPTFPYSVTTAPPYVAPTCLAAPNAPCVQLTGLPNPLPVTTAPPYVAPSVQNIAIVSPLPVPVAIASSVAIPVTIATLPPLSGGTAAIGTVQPGNTQNTTPWLVGGGSTTTILTSASATTCTAISTTATRLWSITASGPATTVFPAFYQNSSCTSATALLGDASTITFGPGQVFVWEGGVPLSVLYYKLSGALTAGQNLIVVTGPQ